MEKDNLIKQFEAYLRQRETLVTQLNQVDGILLFIQNELAKNNSSENSQKTSNV